MIPARRNPESGFAMLLVFAMAAVVALTLYMALPRVAFESQRDKEQSLIDAGEQYKRAVQLYVRKNKRWPAKIEDLENTNGQRYLRRRYLDPMTGKDEWRLIHVGPTGVLTDSLIKDKDKDKGKGGKSVDNFISELAPISGGSDPTGNINPGLRRRASDSGPGPGGQLDGSGNVTVNPDGSGQIQTGQIQGQPQNGANGNAPAPGNLPQQLQRPGAGPAPPANNQTGGISVLGGIGFTPTPAAPTNPNPPNPNGGNSNPGNPNLPTAGQPGGQPGAQPGGQPNPTNAAQLIQNLLTAPRPGGAPANTGSPAGQVQGGGIAGFASKYEGTGIKVYNTQDEYQKWEFVYDMSKDPAVSGQNAANGNGLNGQNGNGQNANGQPTAGQIPTSSGPTSTAK